ncbi:MAG: HAD-IA family hydrolase [Verrucomicrobiales bacterium]|nr:HAD-IA family hydrolase [Verrucomicrobiales bacterium]
MIKGCIFDFDGLILETEYPLYQAWCECYEYHGEKLGLEQYAACVGSDENAFDPVKELNSRLSKQVDWDYWHAKRLNDTQTVLKEQGLMSGVIDCLEEAEFLQLPCTVASSSPRNWVDPHLRRLEIEHYFCGTHCLEDVKKPKPSPELFLLAAASMGLETGEVVVFEDSLNGLLAAQEAGMKCVVVPSPVTLHLDFSEATLVVNSLSEITLERLLLEL